jgi:hypothetical protein
MAWRINVRWTVPFICAVIDFGQRDGKISFEGELGACDWSEVTGVEREPSAAHKRNTMSPVQDFIIVPLSPASVETLKRKIPPHVGLHAKVAHILISRGDKPVFWSYDWFHEGGCGTDDAFDERILPKLREGGVIRGVTEMPHPDFG